MENLIIQLINTLKELSYFGVILALSIETVPAEIVLPMVGFWVNQGDMNFYLAILAGTIGGTTGPLTLYALGRYGGRPLISKYGKYFFIKESHLDASDKFFKKHGPIVAFAGRFIPGVRTAISIPCGITKMNVWLFSIYTFVAMLPITTLYVFLGKQLGANWKQVGPLASTYLLPAAGIVLFLIMLYSLFKIIKKRKNMRKDS